MKLSKKAYYGLRACLTLAESQAPLSVQALAQEERIPELYLEKILQALRRAGVVTAERGTKGGYQLREEALSAWDVVSALDGPLKIFLPEKGTLPCLLPTHCKANLIFRDLETSLESSLKNIPVTKKV